MSSDLVKRTALIGVLAIGLSACSGMGTVVDESDPESELPNVSMGRSIMEGLGAVPSRQLPINYTPRAPLVVPKDTGNLKTPEDPKAVTGSPDWPQDPDVLAQERLREAYAKDRARGDKGKILMPSQLLVDRAPPTPGTKDYESSGRILRPSELRDGPASLGGQGHLYDENGQPVRRALVEPPVDYLQPAPGAPVAIPEEPKKKGFLFWWN